MGLIQHNDTVAGQGGVHLGLPQQGTIRGKLNAGAGGGGVIKPHTVAHQVRGATLRGHTLGQGFGSHTPGLGD